MGGLSKNTGEGMDGRVGIYFGRLFKTISPFSYGLSDSKTPKISRKESFLTPYCNIAYMLLGIFRGHIQ